ncbi:MAG TPA: glycosyltransferase [Thermoanaerobaculia bacterium]|nr:glycosyltransferase [Thermoanaerobaculia bacterium]
MRVVHTIASLRADHGGTSRSVPALCSALSAQGIDTAIVTQEAPFGLEEVSPSDPAVVVRRVRLRSNLSTLLAGNRPFRAAVESALGPTKALLHDHGLWLPTNLLVSRLAAPDRPLIVSPRGMLTDWALAHGRFRKRLAWALYQRRALGRAMVIHATSNEEAAGVERLRSGLPIVVVPNGTDLAPDHNEPTERPRSRVALFLSRFHPKKGALELVRAWSRVSPSGWRLVLAGPDDGGHRGVVEQEIRRLGLGEVEVHGPVGDSEKWQLYRSADLFVLPSHSENFGLVVAEAMACGVPVLTTRGTPWREVEEHRCGWWVELGRDALERALAEATSFDRATLAAMGQRGRRLIETRYSWRRVAADLRRVYAWLLDEGPQPLDLLYSSP